MSNIAPVVLIHGVGLDQHMWAAFGRALGRPVHTYDLIGLGDGPRPPGPYTLAQYADQLSAVVAELGTAPVDLVGFSMGALIAQRFAVDQPDWVRRLVLVSTVFDRTPEERAAILDRVAEVRAGRYGDSIEPALQRWFTDDFATRRPEVVETVRQRMHANDVDAYGGAYEVFATGDAELVPLVDRLTAPTLVVTGELDQRSTPEMARRLAAALPHVIVPGVRHLLPVEAPDTLAELVNSFLDG
jgi:pimeloyl-ACP methyl ester carboxylesterase